MSEVCVCCQDRDAFYVQRRLCVRCYARLRARGRLDSFPKSFSLIGFAERHPGLDNDLKSLVHNRSVTLESVGQKHGISRERVRQLFADFFGFKYTVAVKNKSADRFSQIDIDRQLRCDPRNKVRTAPAGSLIHRGAIGEKRVLEICASLGYEVRPYKEGRTIDLVINGWNVEVKTAFKTCLTSPGAKTPQYHFQLSPSQRIADFVVCYPVPMGAFFVIPTLRWPKSEHFYLPSSPRHEWIIRGGGKRYSESKYYQYLDAWHLLKPAPKEVVFVAATQPSAA